MQSREYIYGKNNGLAKHFIIAERGIRQALRQTNARSPQSWGVRGIKTKWVYVQKCHSSPANQREASHSQAWERHCVLLSDCKQPLEKAQKVFSGESCVILENWDRADPQNKQLLPFVSGTEMLSDLHTLLAWFQSLSKTNLTFSGYF